MTGGRVPIAFGYLSAADTSSEVSSSVPASSDISSSLPASSSVGPVCGDGVLGVGEQCEPPGFGTCNSTCQNATTIGTTGTTNNTTTTTSSVRRLQPPATCGNGVTQPELGEDCDNGRFNGLSNCSLFCENKSCGDGVVSPESGEECEPTEEVCGKKFCAQPECNDGECVGGCKWQFGPQCEEPDIASSSQSSSQQSSSVDYASFVLSSHSSSSATSQASEPTTDVPDVEGVSSEEGAQASSLPADEVMSTEESSSSSEVPSDAQASVEQSSASSMPRLRCGDGELQNWEQCDNGDANSNETPDACRDTCRLPYCGDGVVDMGEQCDDGNDILGDGCTVTCVPSLCGNGVLELGEECDEGVRNSDNTPDSCSTLCLMPRCGDGIVDPAFGEACDQGLTNSMDSGQCRPWCAPPRCGDGILDGEEQCDDGNIVPGDGCDASCMPDAVVTTDGTQEVHAAPPAEPISPWLWLPPVLVLILGGGGLALRFAHARGMK